MHLQPGEKLVWRIGIKICAKKNTLAVVHPWSSILLGQGISMQTWAVPGHGLRQDPEEMCTLLENIGQQSTKIRARSIMRFLVFTSKGMGAGAEKVQKTNLGRDNFDGSTEKN